MKTYRSGHRIKQLGYYSFEPSLINRTWGIDNPKILEALSRADRHLGRLDMFSEYVPNLQLFIQMHVTKEATQSSRIENTCTEIEEAILPEAEISLERRDDWREVNNYIKAMNQGIAALEQLPFSNRLLKDAHRTLLQGARGEHKMPGDFRTSQNWIGGSSPSNARFVPPSHENVPELMSDMERFAHNDELHIPPLIKAALMHYQFETVHPFLDGNGRIGRLMITLYFVSIDILKQPVLYLSDYLERNRDEYYEHLTRVREQNALEDWLLFFLDGITETATKSINTFDQILSFQKQWEQTIHGWKKYSNSGSLLFRHLFQHPAVNAQEVAEAIGASAPTAYKLIEHFVEQKLLREVTGAKRGKLYIFDPYLQLYRS